MANSKDYRKGFAHGIRAGFSKAKTKARGKNPKRKN